MLTIAIVAALAALLTGWAALIVQSLRSGGAARAYFASVLKTHCPPDNDNDIVLDERFRFVDSNGVRWDSPAAMESDGASVGVLLRIPIIGTLVIWLIKGTPLTGPLRPASIPHDYIYGSATESSFWKALIASRRAVADRVIYEAAMCGEYLLADKRVTREPLAQWRAFAVMALLRLAGFKAWMDDSSRAQRSLRSLSTTEQAR